ncbi:MAG: 6-phosphogluconolactonase [Caldilinea sp.]|nr:6-phosphogluconolactonase [Caldilinea sp.]MDW8442045.1 6-phosphogluconolactonase [Caldilineaceae bacterium]
MESKVQVEVAPSAEDLAHVACELIAAAATASIGRRQFFRVALAGGSTPRAVYRLLAQDSYMDFRRWQIFWSDERCVPPTSPESNYRMVKEELLDRLAEPPALVFRMAGEGDPDAAALAYERAVRELVPPNSAAGTGDTPRFDLILLGMGVDGHTASLFPGTPALHERVRLVVANPAPTGQMRLTFTYPLINAARRVLILVSGAEKAATLRAVFTGPHDPVRYPVQGVRLVRGNLTWLVDKAAYGESDAPS